MTLRLFVMPQIGIGTDADPFRPKYAAQLATVTWVQYDPQPGALSLVGIYDLTAAQLAQLVAQPDVKAIPPQIDPAVGSVRLAKIEAALRQAHQALVDALDL